MSNMCTCHIDSNNCDWCRVQNVKKFCEQVTQPGNLIKDILIVAEQLEGYLLKSVAQQILEEPQFSAVEFLNKMESWGNNCGSCKYMDTKDNRCTNRGIFIKSTSPKCPDWRYVG